MKKIGSISAMAGTAEGFGIVVVPTSEVPVGTDVYIEDAVPHPDTVRLEALVTALGCKDLKFMAALSRYSPKIANLAEVRHAIDMAIKDTEKCDANPS